MNANLLIRILIAFLLPPLSVLLTVGARPAVLVNIALTLMFYLPGLIHALYMMTQPRTA